jgi:hypothetical protein
MTWAPKTSPARAVQPDPTPARPDAGSAHAIYQAYLDQVTAWVWAGEDAKVAASMAYPQTIVTTDCEMTFDTTEGPAQMVRAVADFRASLRRLGATEYHRICSDARFLDDGRRIEGSHVTYVLRGGTYALEPFVSRMAMRRDAADRWRGAGLRVTVSNRCVTVLSPQQVQALRGGLPGRRDTGTAAGMTGTRDGSAETNR